MRLQNAEFLLVRVPLRFPVRHGSYVRRENLTGFIALKSDSGHVGCGELLCRPYVTGEDMADCEALLPEMLRTLTRAEIEDPRRTIQDLSTFFQGRNGCFAALCGVDLALIDLWSHVHGIAVHSWLNAQAPTARAIEYSAVCPLTSSFKSALLHLRHRLMGMRQIKVKGCGAIESDLKSLSQIRRWMPPDVDLRLDLNGSLTPATANDYFSRLAKHHPTVTWIEQPFSKDAWIQSAALQRNFGEQFTFCADESVCTLEDLERAASTGAFRAINLRIAKHGGLVATQAIWRQARQLGLATQLGCLVGETTLLAAAGLHLAAATPHLRYHEGCFGRRLLAWDVVQPSLVFGYGGKVPLARLPSSGLTSPIDLSGVRRRAIKSFAVGKNS